MLFFILIFRRPPGSTRPYTRLPYTTLFLSCKLIQSERHRGEVMSGPQSLMAGKRGLGMGVANDRSIAWGIATAAREQGAELAFTFQGEALERRVRPLAESVGAEMVMPCEVTDDASIDEIGRAHV